MVIYLTDEALDFSLQHLPSGGEGVEGLNQGWSKHIGECIGYQ